jgi:hypothetical protein
MRILGFDDEHYFVGVEDKEPALRRAIVVNNSCYEHVENICDMFDPRHLREVFSDNERYQQFISTINMLTGYSANDISQSYYVWSTNNREY